MDDVPPQFAMPFEVRVASRREVAGIARAFRPTHLVSVVAKAPIRLPSVPADSMLHLLMDDVVVPRRSLSPAPRHVRALFGFADAVPPGARVLFHCEAGISRSSAAAWICLVRRAGLGSAGDAALYVRSVRAMADPNPLLVKLAATALMDTQGHMEAARRLFDGWRLAFDDEDSFGTLPGSGVIRPG